MPMFFSYGFGRPVKREMLRTISVERRSDGFVKEVTVWEWTFADGTVRTCLTMQSYRPCKTGGVEFPNMPGRWSWTGERYTEPFKEAA